MDARSASWTRAAGRALAGVLPRRCLLCGAGGSDGLDLCAACAADLPRNTTCCTRCALPLAHPAPLCGTCQQRAPRWNGAWVPFVYGWPLSRLETRFKFHGDLASGRVLSDLWTRQSPPREMPDLIVPVPLHRSRLRQRGYNQALELARPLARAMGVPVSTRVLQRVRAMSPQSERDARERRVNVRRAFGLHPHARLPDHVALLDDVLTTGATLNECARVLRRAGVRSVDVWALARVP